MIDSKLKDYRFEIMALQTADNNNAYENGFNTKQSWCNYIIKQEYDEIAQAIISISERYEVPLEQVAYDFDPTMIIRVTKILKDKNNTIILK